MNSHPERSNFISWLHVLEVIYEMKNKKFELSLWLKQTKSHLLFSMYWKFWGTFAALLQAGSFLKIILLVYYKDFVRTKPDCNYFDFMTLLYPNYTNS